ncbi:serine/threonine-protein phosphatase 6 regulatory ankyrin repeat subunit B-like [Cloeon dipterum]|uniref:serine/threonine-protein phosphatase 6 regulatory ankyrin repeat subunit B-like n=1 Tax=Cloeon dipterum TaxID=197152 RepID=UPI003220225B
MAFQLGKLNPDLQILRISLPRVPFSSLDRNVTEIEFLVKATKNSKEEIIKSIESKQCVVILDGFDEIIRPDNQEKTLKVIEALEKKQISVWIGTRPNAAEAIKNRISKAVIVKIDPLKKKQQIEFLKLETGKSREECELFIENFASKDILENPLHLSLVANYGAKGNLYQIYDKVVRHKVKDTLIRKAVDKNKEDDFGEILAFAILDLQKLASNHFRGFELPDYVKDDLEKNNYYGIASFQNNHVIFIHQTFAEFLAARHFLREIENSGDWDIQSSTEDIADLFLGKSFSWCRKFVDLFYSTVLNDAEKIEKRRTSILRVMRLKPDIFLGLMVEDVCINIFKMVYPIITFSEKQEGNCITVAKDDTLLFRAIEGAEEIAIMLLDTDLINSDDELLIILPHLLNLVAESNACLFFEKLETKFPRLPEMIHSRRSIIRAGAFAAGMNHGEILHLLLQNGVDKDFQGDEGSTLYLAIYHGAIKCVEVLLKHGAKLAIDEDGESWDPLMMAVEENELDLVKLLVEENISGLQRNKETFEINEVESDLNVLHFAIQEGYTEIAKFLIEKSPGLKNVENGDDESLLKFSAKSKCLEICQMLIEEEGVDVNTLRPSGEPRDWTLDDNICMDHFLILQKSDVNMTDERGKTALHCAAEHGYLERVKELINAGANIQAVDENGWNAFHFACSSVRYFDDDDEMNEIHENTVQIIQKLHSTDSQLAKEKTGRGQTGLHIHLKFSYCSVEVTRFLVEEIGVDVKAKDNNGCTALRIAVKKGQRFVDYLMTKDIDLEVKTKRGRTCLHLAAGRGDLEALQTWIELGGDFNVVDEKGMTALHIAAENGHLQFVKKFLACATEEVQNQDLGEGFVGSKLKERLNRCDNEGRTALHLAAESGNVDLVELLLENNADLTHADKVGRTALHFAAESGNVDLVEWLLKNNADLTQMDMKGKNAIHYAIKNEKMLRFLNKKNGDLLKQRTKYGDTTLHLALNLGFNDAQFFTQHLALERYRGETEEITLWIIKQVDDTVLNAKNDSGETPLLLACQRRFWRVAELLLSRNVEVNVSNRSGKTAMHYAAEYVNLYLLKLLHEKGVDLTLTDNKGKNALHHAAAEGNLSLVKHLLEKGVDLTLRDNQGMNALHHALENFEVVLFLHEKNNELLGQRLQNGDTALHFALKTWDIDTDTIHWLVEQCEIDLNVTNSEGETPLMLACMNRRWDVSKILLDKRVDIHVKDKNGRTALHYAVNSYHDLVQELCKRGADLALTDNDGMNAFHHAIGSFQMALFIHNLNGDLVKQRLNNEDTSLHLAIKLYKRNKNDDVLNWLAEQDNVDLNARNALNETPLILACKEKLWDTKFVEILLSKNIDVTIKDIEGNSAHDYIDESCPAHLLRRFDELQEASSGNKCEQT